MGKFLGNALLVLVELLMLALAFLCGLVVVAAATSSGPSWMLFWGLVTAGCLGALGWLITYMFADMMDLDSWRQFTVWTGTLVFALVTFWPPAEMLIHGHNEAAYMRQMAPKVRAFMHEHFEQVDATHDGVVTDTELEAALSKPEFNSEQREIIQLMRNDISEVGHVTGSSTSTTFVWISTGNGGGYMSPIITTTYTYGISPPDVDGYPARVGEKYRLW